MTKLLKNNTRSNKILEYKEHQSMSLRGHIAPTVYHPHRSVLHSAPYWKCIIDHPLENQKMEKVIHGG